MESTGLKNTSRFELLEKWLAEQGDYQGVKLQPLAHDASFRRYFRLQTPNDSRLIMDAPPPTENCRPYVAIANALRELGLNTPEIMHADLEQGFLMITDFGDATYLKILNNQNADQLYGRAIDALAILHQCATVKNHTVPAFTSEFMWQEWAWHQEWFSQKLLGLEIQSEKSALDACYGLIVESALSQPQVFMHRDFHSANLMLTKESGVRQVGILDFQDAFIGPLTYDLVSLLRDCYIDWPEEKVKEWALLYHQKLMAINHCNVDAATFLRWFDFMSLQRHLKALLTFARKQVRDGQSQYLKFIPRTLNYLLIVSRRYPELKSLHHYLADKVQPALEQKVKLCAR